jgi:hypothetical protein
LTHDDAKAAYARRVEIVKARLRADAKALARELVPHGKLHGQTWSALPPHRDSDNDTAFAIYVSGPKAGGWKDFVSGETGDALNLVMLVKALSFKEAVAWAEDRYGLRHLSPEAREALQRDVVKRQALMDVKEEERRAKNIRNACHMFSKAVPEIEGTLVDRYLKARGIDLRALPYRDTRWLRFLPHATYWMDERRPQLPAMIAGMVDGQGVMKAIHLTFLRGDGRGKADVAKPKLMWPEVKGLVIRLNHGWGNLDPETMAGHLIERPLMLCEGIEDGLSIAMGDPELRVWAASSLSNLLNVPDHNCASSYVVAQDNDWGKPAAAAGFKKALTRLRDFKKPVVAVRSTTGKDFNDQLKGN